MSLLMKLKDIGDAPLILVLSFAIDLEAQKQFFVFDEAAEEVMLGLLGEEDDGDNDGEFDAETPHPWPREMLELFGITHQDGEDSGTPPGWWSTSDPFPKFYGMGTTRAKQEKFKTLFPETASQIMLEKQMRRYVLSPARALGQFALVCKAFCALVSEPALEEQLYSGMVHALGQEFKWESSSDGKSPDQGDLFLTGLFLRENKLRLANTGYPSRIRVSNSDPALGFFFGQNQHDFDVLEKTRDRSSYFDHCKPREDHLYEDHFISDDARAQWLRSLRAHDLTKSQRKAGQEKDDAQFDWNHSPYKAAPLYLDPRMMHWIHNLEGTPVRAKQRFADIASWVDGNLSRLRSVIFLGPTGELAKVLIPNPFKECFEWCLDSIARWEEAEGEHDGSVSTWVEPDMHRVFDSILTWAVEDYNQGCSHYVSHDVLFELGRSGKRGWDNWTPWSGSSEYFVPFMICKVPNGEWP